MRRSIEVLEHRLAMLNRIRDTHQHHVRSAMRSDASPADKAAISINSASWMEHWAAVHTKAWALWLEAGGTKS